MRRPQRTPRALATLVAVALCATACTDNPAEPGPQPPAELAEQPATPPTTPPPTALLLRLHVVQSTELDALNARLTDQEAQGLIAAVNQAWFPAGIVWILESVVREDARSESAFREALINQALSPVKVLPTVLAPDNLDTDIWNVFMIRDFGPTLGGAYLPVHKVVVAAEIDPRGQRDVTGDMAHILAHELGHSLGLAHVPCTEAGNLMAADCPNGSRTYLDPSQITRAQLQADFGRPF